MNDVVEANYGSDKDWFRGIVKKNEDEQYCIVEFEGNIVREIETERIRPCSMSYRVHERIEANFGGSNEWLPGIISRINRDGSYSVDYLDGRKEIRVRSEYLRYASSPSQSAGGFEQVIIDTLDNGMIKIAELRELFIEYEKNLDPFQKRLSNSRHFSSLFKRDDGIVDNNFHYHKKSEDVISHISDLQKLEKKRREALDSEIDRMKQFDKVISQAKAERDSYRIRIDLYQEGMNNMLIEDTIKGYLKKKNRVRAMIVLNRFFKHLQSRNKLKKALCKYVLKKRVLKVRLQQSKAALIIQKNIRRKLAMVRAHKVRTSSLTIQRMCIEMKQRLLAREKFTRRVQLTNIALWFQARMRGMRARRLVAVLRRERLEARAAHTIQKLYRRK